MMEITKDMLDAFGRRLAEEGKLVEAGWTVILRGLPPDPPASMVNVMRFCYMAGAHHLFTAMMNILEDGEEPTDADMQRVMMIGKELEKFTPELEQVVRGRRN